MGSEKDAITRTLDKYKRRVKRLVCCCALFNVLGVISLVVAIVLLVFYAAYISDPDDWRRGVAFFAIVLLILSLVFVGIGVLLAVIGKKLYDRATGNVSHAGNYYQPRSYVYGSAPYPQQPPEDNQEQTNAQQPSVNPDSDVKVQITEHHGM